MPNFKNKNLNAFAAIVLLAVSSCGCQAKPVTDFYYMVAKQTQVSPQTTLNLTIVRRFEKEVYCEDEAKQYVKSGFAVECPYNERIYDTALNGEPTGKWYILHRIDKIMSVAIIFDFDRPPPDEIVLAQLKKIAPHPVKMAALFQAPAEALIFAPSGDVRYQEKFKR